MCQVHWADSEDPRWAGSGGADLDRFLAATESAHAVWVEEVAFRRGLTAVRKRPGYVP